MMPKFPACASEGVRVVPWWSHARHDYKCYFERLVAFSCKKRGFCPSSGARRMAETAALLADEVFPDVPLRQWVISFPFPIRTLFAAHPQAMGKVQGIVYRAISTHLIHKAKSRFGPPCAPCATRRNGGEIFWLQAAYVTATYFRPFAMPAK